jgi:dipeptidyl aminopeptidase/acylaminoacyl peptidase
MRLILAVLPGAVACAAAGAQAPPSTDVFLAPLHVTATGVSVGAVNNITDRPGYDNQPSFTPDSRSILFTSVRDDGQSDIYRFDIATRAIARVTTTPESEYSATVMPDGRRFSVIRVEKDSAQRLWSFALDGSDPRIVLTRLKPVGYHAWIDSRNLALFVLGKPNALVHANVATGALDTLARDIGRSLQPLPDRIGFSFTQRTDSGTFRLKTMRWPSRATKDLIELPRGTEDIAWLGKGMVLAAQGTRLVLWHSGDVAWRTVADHAASNLTSITRLAVSPDGKWLALVAVPKAGP